MYNTSNTTQFSIFDSHSFEPKQEVGTRNLSLFLPPFLPPVMRFAKLNKAPLEISPLPLYEVPPPRARGMGLIEDLQYIANPGLPSMTTFSFKRYPLIMAKTTAVTLLIINNLV